MKQYRRSQRIGKQMLRDVQNLLEQECAQNLDAMVTFTDVEVTDDLRFAKVFYTVLGDEAQKNRAAGYFANISRRVTVQLGKLLRIKSFPEVTFEFDSSLERGIRVEQLLNEIAEKKNEQEDQKDI